MGLISALLLHPVLYKYWTGLSRLRFPWGFQPSRALVLIDIVWLLFFLFSLNYNINLII